KKVDVSLDKHETEPSKNIIDALCDDLNTPEALGALNILINSIQDADEAQKKEIMPTIYSSARMLGILQHEPDSWLGYSKVDDGKDTEKIEQMIEERNNCRNSKNFEQADKIRDELKSMGIDIEDTSDGTIWRNED
ncbi:MAG: DALR domain-containing protein, partial [Candidatus Neomarinimicrobiota bacterium]|nr:DALR domain-containing protein [Candidatus Neomarinimicrobiota bacterium]